MKPTITRDPWGTLFYQQGTKVSISSRRAIRRRKKKKIYDDCSHQMKILKNRIHKQCEFVVVSIIVICACGWLFRHHPPPMNGTVLFFLVLFVSFAHCLGDDNDHGIYLICSLRVIIIPIWNKRRCNFVRFIFITATNNRRKIERFFLAARQNGFTHIHCQSPQRSIDPSRFNHSSIHSSLVSIGTSYTLLFLIWKAD